MSGNVIFRHHVEPRIKLYSPKEESFPIRIDDHWNVDGSRDLSDSWTGFTQFTLSSEKLSQGFLLSGCETDTTASDIQARSFMARTLEWIGKKYELREKQKWSMEKRKLDNARSLRGIFFIDPEDKENKETIWNARRKLETPLGPAIPEEQVW